MNTRKFILRETAFLAIGELICTAAMVGIFALLGYFDYKVVLGGVFGCLIAVGNFFLMAVLSNAAADRAAEQQVKEGKTMVKSSYGMRLLVIGVLLFLLAKSGHCNILALVIPLFFEFPVLMVIEFLRKSGESKS